MDESISLRELVDVDIVQAIQDSFAKTVGVSSVIFLPDGDALTRFSNPTKFCSLIRSTKEGRRRCFQSFAEMSRKALELSEPEIMYCFAYGAHFVAPIIIDGERKATMYAGQFKPEKFSPEQLKELEKIAMEIDLDPKSLVEEGNKARVVGEDVVRDHSHLLFRTVEVIAELGAQALGLRQAKDALQNAHNELEIRVQERTAELTETNKELRREIAERKAAEDALRESEEKLRSIVEQSGDGVVLADEEGAIIEWNRGQERITGLSRAEVLGRLLWDVMFQVAANEHDNPALYERIKAGVLKILETGQSEWLDRLEERVVRRPDGARRVMQVAVFPIKTGKGFMTGAISRDITKRKRADDSLRESEGTLSAMLRSLGDHISMMDKDLNILWANDVAKGLFGDDIIGKKCYEVYHGRNKPCEPSPCLTLKAFEDGRLHKHETMVQTRAGDTLQYACTASVALRDDEGMPAAVIEISRDITERKAAEEQIKRSLREKDVLMHEMHHRVKNNLQVVSSLLSMQARTTRNKEAIDVLSKAQSRINTMALIHTQLYESGDLSELNMKEFVGKLSEQLFRSYPVNDTKIARIVRMTDRKFPISVGVYVGLIINELLSNALQHAFVARKDGKIEVDLTISDSGRVNLIVSDDGVGLPPGFDIDKTRSLGLHIVKILIEDQLQGKLGVISDGGATFNMEFDLKDNGGSSHGEDTNTDR